MKRIGRVILIFILLPLLLAGCNIKSKEKRFQEYIDAWKKLDYASMYEMLSTEAKGRISREAFAEDHDKRYRAMEASNLSINIIEEKSGKKTNEEKDILSFNFKMDTLAGVVEFIGKAPMIKEQGDKGKGWFVNWSPSMFHKDMKEGSTLKVVGTEPQRGRILDRNGVELAVTTTERVKDIAIRKTKFNISDIEKLSIELGMSKDTVERKVKAGSDYVSLKYMSSEEYVAKKAALSNIVGVEAPSVSIRYYPFKEVTTNLLGYKNDYKKELTRLEKQFDDKLEGEKGYKITITDNKNNELTIAKKDVKHGEDVVLEIDSYLQQLLYDELKDDIGAAVAINPKTGEVLALVSTPSVDGNIAARATTAEENALLKNEKGNPMNANYNDSFAPGSTIKPFTAAIGLEKNKFDHTEGLNISGPTWDNNGDWKDYPIKRVEPYNPKVDLRTALIFSDNIYFSMIAQKIGIKDFTDGMKAFGIGDNVPNFTDTVLSQISDEKGITNNKKLADSSYGQGTMEITPVQLAYMYTAFLNEGNIVKPILERSEDKALPELWKEKVINPENAKLINSMLVDAVEYDGGTGNQARIKGKTIGGKTGTAQTNNNKLDGWFVGFDADENPELLIVMMVRNVDSELGSHYVVPKVKNVMEKYLK